MAAVTMVTMTWVLDRDNTALPGTRVRDSTTIPGINPTLQASVDNVGNELLL